ncbi:ASC1-like protein 3 [Scenedesmus sp. PABB004]|nr:ASC1-like protein 3 [Scenedesmus sp. PABB004]
MHSAVEKFCESLWKLCVYTAFFGLGLAAVWQQPWLLDTWQFWVGWPHHEFTLPMQLLYSLELGFYIASVFMIVAWEVRRRDFAAMFAHHVATVVLIAASLHLGFWRVGVVVMVLHDACDVLMEAAKLAKYAAREDAAVGLFAVFVAAWLALRLVAFPLMVLRSSLFELPAVLGGGPAPAWLRAFNALLLGLLLLHCYWFGLILRVVWLTLATGAASDVREDDD